MVTILDGSVFASVGWRLVALSRRARTAPDPGRRRARVKGPAMTEPMLPAADPLSALPAPVCYRDGDSRHRAQCGGPARRTAGLLAEDTATSARLTSLAAG